MSDDPAAHDARARRRAALHAIQLAFAQRIGPARFGHQSPGLQSDSYDAQARAVVEGIAPRKLAFYRTGLRFKRLAEVRALLPYTRRVLGEEFDRRFLAFCETFEPLGFARHREDAIAFAASLGRAEARVERAYLLAARNVAGVWVALGSRGLVVLARLRRGARLRRFALDLPFAGNSR